MKPRLSPTVIPSESNAATVLRVSAMLAKLVHFGMPADRKAPTWENIRDVASTVFDSELSPDDLTIVIVALNGIGPVVALAHSERTRGVTKDAFLAMLQDAGGYR
jgi:hypothetical protein